MWGILFELRIDHIWMYCWTCWHEKSTWDRKNGRNKSRALIKTEKRQKKIHIGWHKWHLLGSLRNIRLEGEKGSMVLKSLEYSAKEFIFCLGNRELSKSFLLNIWSIIKLNSSSDCPPWEMREDSSWSHVSAHLLGKNTKRFCFKYIFKKVLGR